MRLIDADATLKKMKNGYCANCGNPIKYGDSYTSLEIHTMVGYGYAVCTECFEAEWERKKEREK